MRTQLFCLIFLLTGCNCMHGGCGSQMSEQTQFAGNIYSEWGSFLKEQGNGLFFRGDFTLAKGVFSILEKKNLYQAISFEETPEYLRYTISKDDETINVYVRILDRNILRVYYVSSHVDIPLVIDTTLASLDKSKLWLSLKEEIEDTFAQEGKHKIAPIVEPTAKVISASLGNVLKQLRSTLLQRNYEELSTRTLGWIRFSNDNIILEIRIEPLTEGKSRLLAVVYSKTFQHPPTENSPYVESLIYPSKQNKIVDLLLAKSGFNASQ